MILIKKENDFKENVLKAEKPVLVDFWATWCGPCRMLAPELESLEKAHPELEYAKVNVDELPDIASAYGISSIPTLILFKDGNQAGISIGYKTQDQLKDFISQ